MTLVAFNGGIKNDRWLLDMTFHVRAKLDSKLQGKPVPLVPGQADMIRFVTEFGLMESFKAAEKAIAGLLRKAATEWPAWMKTPLEAAKNGR